MCAVIRSAEFCYKRIQVPKSANWYPFRRWSSCHASVGAWPVTRLKNLEKCERCLNPSSIAIDFTDSPRLKRSTAAWARKSSSHFFNCRPRHSRKYHRNCRVEIPHVSAIFAAENSLFVANSSHSLIRSNRLLIYSSSSCRPLQTSTPHRWYMGSLSFSRPAWLVHENHVGALSVGIFFSTEGILASSHNVQQQNVRSAFLFAAKRSAFRNWAGPCFV